VEGPNRFCGFGENQEAKRKIRISKTQYSNEKNKKIQERSNHYSVAMFLIAIMDTKSFDFRHEVV